MGYYLLDNRNTYGPNYYTTRRGSILAIVVHITAGLQDQGYEGSDLSAEGTARYAATTSRDVSWHSGSDSDSNLLLLPDTYTAFHVRGYNSRTIGHEISKLDVSWSDEPERWVTDTLTQAANCLRPRAQSHNIPLRRASKAELDRAILNGGAPVGFIGHHDLDPTRRSDPGSDFPWARFLSLIKDPTVSHTHAMPVLAYKTHSALISGAVKDLQGHLNAWRRNRGLSVAPADGVFTEHTHIAVTTFQRWYGLTVDGIVGAATWAKVHSITKGVILTP